MLVRPPWDQPQDYSCPSPDLVELGEGLGVVELDGLDAAHVVQVAAQLVVGRPLREARLGHHVRGLLHQVEVQQVPEDEVQQLGTATTHHGEGQAS